MTIDEITTALKEWGDDNEDKHYLLIAVEDGGSTVAVKGTEPVLGYALADTMRSKKEVGRTVKWAMHMKDLNIFED